MDGIQLLDFKLFSYYYLTSRLRETSKSEELDVSEDKCITVHDLTLLCATNYIP